MSESRPGAGAGLRASVLVLMLVGAGVWVARSRVSTDPEPAPTPESIPASASVKDTSTKAKTEEPAASIADVEPAIPASADEAEGILPTESQIRPKVSELPMGSSVVGGVPSTELGGLGKGSLGSRGAGIGGGGTALGYGGLGTKGRGSGASGYGGSTTLGTLSSGSGGSAVGGIVGTKSAPGRRTSTAQRRSETAPMDATLAVVPRAESPPSTGTMTQTSADARSTFAADVDTGSYTYARSQLKVRRLPDPASVRVEEFVNYFRYDYAQPKRGELLGVDAELVPHPTVDGRHLLRIGVQAKTVAKDDRKPVRLTFLVDTSGSMRGPDRLGLAQQSMAHTLRGLGAEDTVSIVTYAGSTQVVLPPTPATQRATIERAIQQLRSGGGTAMDSGMSLAYQQAEQSYAEGAENRVIVMSDGDANIGRTSADEMLETIRRHAEGGITLTTVGFGTGNYQDWRMERLADAGDGVYVYIDSFDEAKRVFGQHLGSTLESVARDVKLQVSFDPSVVRSWRQVGYENRQIADQDFRNDAVDAGEVGSGHQVTALYELELAFGTRLRAPLGAVHLRAKPPGPDRPAEEWEHELRPRTASSLADAGPDTRLALAAMFLAEGLAEREAVPLGKALVLSRELSGDGRKDATELETLAQVALDHVDVAVQYTLGPVKTQGELDETMVRDELDRFSSRFESCYQVELRRRPESTGELSVRVVLAGDGAVEKAVVRRKSFESPNLEACVLDRFQQMRFVNPQKEVAVLEVPLRFSPG